MNGTGAERMEHLFKAARQDGPSPESRVAMWVGIETASLSLGAGGVSAASVTAAKTAAVATSKLLLGLFLGAALTVGVASAVVVGMISLRDAQAVHAAAAAVQPRALERPAPAASQHDPAVISGHVAPEVIELPATEPNPAVRTGTTTLSEHDRLAREARMVNEARGALHRDEPEVALRTIRAARTQPGARLIPEELTVEAQALRALGDEAGAQRIDAQLASKLSDGELPSH